MSINLPADLVRFRRDYRCLEGELVFVSDEALRRAVELFAFIDENGGVPGARRRKAAPEKELSQQEEQQKPPDRVCTRRLNRNIDTALVLCFMPNFHQGKCQLRAWPSSRCAFAIARSISCLVGLWLLVSARMCIISFIDTHGEMLAHAHQYRNRRRPHERGPKGLWPCNQETNCRRGPPIDDQTAAAT